MEAPLFYGENFCTVITEHDFVAACRASIAAKANRGAGHRFFYPQKRWNKLVDKPLMSCSSVPAGPLVAGVQEIAHAMIDPAHSLSALGRIESYRYITTACD